MKVVLAARGEGHLAERLREALGPSLVVVRPGEREPLRRELADADALLVNSLEAADTDGASSLRLVQALSAGADRVDPAALPPGCVLCNLYEHEDAIAEWVLMAVLALTRHLLVYDAGLRRGDWGRGLPVERELRGRVVGTIGYGHIGRRVVHCARAFGMEAVAVTRSPAADRADGLRWLGGPGDLERLLRESDVAVICVPLAPETEGLIGGPELDLLGPEGYLANVARGEIVDEQALYEALRDGRIAGAALDVWYRYPSGAGERVEPSRFPFGELENVVMTPHISGRAEGTRRRRAEFVLEQLRRLERGHALENVLAVGQSKAVRG